MTRKKNQFFKFKQFTVRQDKTAMKVCTDSCLFGAVIETRDSTCILDIGTGTGLLALMVAQKCNVPVTAIEIDQNAFEQASENFANSPFAGRFNLNLQDFAKFASETDQKFDLVICNPPFYENNLKSSDPGRNMALHRAMLSTEELLDGVLKLLAHNGRFYILLPNYEAGLFESAANLKGLFAQKKIVVHNSPGKPVFRVVTSYGPGQKPCETEIIFIKDETGEYSQSFRSRLKPYYLAF